LVEDAVGGAAMPDVAVVASIVANTLLVLNVKVADAPVVCAILEVGYVVHVDAAIFVAVRDGAEQPARYAVVPVHVPAVVQEHDDASPKLLVIDDVAVHAAVV